MEAGSRSGLRSRLFDCLGYLIFFSGNDWHQQTDGADFGISKNGLPKSLDFLLCGERVKDIGNHLVSLVGHFFCLDTTAGEEGLWIEYPLSKVGRFKLREFCAARLVVAYLDLAICRLLPAGHLFIWIHHTLSLQIFGESVLSERLVQACEKLFQSADSEFLDFVSALIDMGFPTLFFMQTRNFENFIEVRCPAKGIYPLTTDRDFKSPYRGKGKYTRSVRNVAYVCFVATAFVALSHFWAMKEISDALDLISSR
ncbi:MAG: hypothetical protein PW790_11075 [Parvibaculaceae bacterium]|nr:hypothetical protein [Parvibaculaceae bacterium]